MSKITVKLGLEKEYTVNIGTDILKNTGEIIGAIHSPCRVAFITDFTVGTYYTNTVVDSLKDSGFEVYIFAYPAGESSKNMETYEKILEFLADNQITRSDLIVELGGGVAGDLAGFAAATYMRGIDYVQIPTSLLAMVDSSVGGKTSIDLESGKNLCGAFWQPISVICSVDTLETLDKKFFDDGVAEIIKYGMLGNEKILKILHSCVENHDNLHFALKPFLEEIVEEAINTKISYVKDDVLDTGRRQYLNFGHTIGHAIEHASRYAIPHGHAVAVGMCSMAKAGEALGITEEGTANKIKALVRECGLPTSTIISPKDLYNSALSDKKRRGENINLVFPISFGKCEIKSVKIDELLNIITLGVK
ncbi:MAG: 3-dehydroquinate synthase [Clostridia bacterium]|nr:3-dehydroquinate synthase [Clostridia bacterium]